MNDPFVLVPPNLAGLAALTGVPGRYSIAGVLVKVEDLAYEACATDGRCLALVKGPVEGDPLRYPTIPELAVVLPSVPQAVIPKQAWKEAFKAAPRGKAVAEQPALGNVAVHLGPAESVLASTDGASATITRAPNVEGQFPDYAAIIPKGEPQLRVAVNPQHLADLLELARRFTPEGTARVELEFRGPDTPVVLRASNGRQQFLGLLMPLV
jgi:DNA polymerase III sliding clamp (beta) subunit (PCNA family)